jgi:uncharacterized protein with NRDE domain
MCLVAFAFGVHPHHPLVLVANRDERHSRPTAPLDWWREPPILAGRDLEAGGTWFGIVPGGRFAVVTNVRGAGAPPGAPSRGTLPTRFLASTAAPEAFLADLADEAGRYAGFNLLVGNGNRLGVLSNCDPHGPRPLGSGVHALSNGPPGVAWPKVRLATERLRAALEGPLDDEALFAVLADRTVADDAHLPDTGVGLPLERVLSPAFIVQPDYGTRSTTLLVLDPDGGGRVAERTFDATGAVRATQAFTLPTRR